MMNVMNEKMMDVLTKTMMDVIKSELTPRYTETELEDKYDDYVKNGLSYKKASKKTRKIELKHNYIDIDGVMYKKPTHISELVDMINIDMNHNRSISKCHFIFDDLDKQFEPFIDESFRIHAYNLSTINMILRPGVKPNALHITTYHDAVEKFKHAPKYTVDDVRILEILLQHTNTELKESIQKLVMNFRDDTTLKIRGKSIVNDIICDTLLEYAKTTSKIIPVDIELYGMDDDLAQSLFSAGYKVTIVLKKNDEKEPSIPEVEYQPMRSNIHEKMELDCKNMINSLKRKLLNEGKNDDIQSIIECAEIMIQNIKSKSQHAALLYINDILNDPTIEEIAAFIHIASSFDSCPIKFIKCCEDDFIRNMKIVRDSNTYAATMMKDDEM